MTISTTDNTGSNMNDSLLTNGMGMTLKNGSLEGITVSADVLRATAEANSTAGVIPSYSYTTEESEQTASIQWDVRDASNFNGSEAVAATPTQYVEYLEDCIRQTLNGDYFKQAFHQTGIACEFRPARTQPTPQIRHIMKPTSIIFDPSKRFIDFDTLGTATGTDFDDVKAGTVEAGAEIHIKPNANAIHFSANTRVLDWSIMGSGFTAGGVESTLNGLIKDIELSLSDSIVSVLDNSEAVKNIQVAPLKARRTAPEIAQDILDAIAMAGRQSGFADTLGEMAIICPTAVEAALLQLAQRNGFSGDDAIRQMLGTSTLGYRDTSASGAIYIAPKSLLMLSWRSAKDGSGDLFRVMVSRDAPRQAWVLEVNSCIDLVADAFIQWKEDTSLSTGEFTESDYFNTDNLGNGQLASYDQIKHIIKLTFDGTEQEFISLPGISMKPLSIGSSDVKFTTGVDNSFPLTATGGIQPYTFDVKFKAGALPTGVTVANGEVNFKAPAAAMAGEYEITVVDGQGSKATKAITVAVEAATTTNP